jgi:hypothetical protein
MLYAILCYHTEDVVCSWTQEEEATVMGRLDTVHQKLGSQGRLGPVARLLPSTTATTVRKSKDPAVVLDGPFAETKEQLLGFYVIESKSLTEALEVARELGDANPGGAYEVRPIALFKPGALAG